MVLEHVLKVVFVYLAVDRPRPVIILGIQESQVVEILLDDPMFEKCPVGMLVFFWKCLSFIQFCLPLI